jgi:hypothetical protein
MIVVFFRVYNFTFRIMQPLDSKQIAFFRDNGYLVVDKVIDEAVCQKVAASITQDAFYMAFRDHNPDALMKLPNANLLFTSLKERKKAGLDENCIYLNGNTRTPVNAKNNGMLNDYHNPEVLGFLWTLFTTAQGHEAHSLQRVDLLASQPALLHHF